MSTRISASEDIHHIHIILTPLLFPTFPSQNLKPGTVRSLPTNQVQERSVGVRRSLMAKKAHLIWIYRDGTEGV